MLKNNEVYLFFHRRDIVRSDETSGYDIYEIGFGSPEIGTELTLSKTSDKIYTQTVIVDNWDHPDNVQERRQIANALIMLSGANPIYHYSSIQRIKILEIGPKNNIKFEGFFYRGQEIKGYPHGFKVHIFEEKTPDMLLSMRMIITKIV